MAKQLSTLFLVLFLSFSAYACGSPVETEYQEEMIDFKEEEIEEMMIWECKTETEILTVYFTHEQQLLLRENGSVCFWNPEVLTLPVGTLCRVIQ